MPFSLQSEYDISLDESISVKVKFMVYVLYINLQQIESIFTITMLNRKYMKSIIIAGSSRKDGDTAKLVANIKAVNNGDTVDLNELQFSYYDYAHLNRDDDFIPSMRQWIAEYDTFIFVSPVYWYAMSGIMKVFFDRLSDLITIEKDLGRKLRGKNMAVFSVSNGNNLGENFWLPFMHTAEYLDMNYLGNLHTNPEEDNRKLIETLIKSFK
jgi:multimeric flavodoxin WrbA